MFTNTSDVPQVVSHCVGGFSVYDRAYLCTCSCTRTSSASLSTGECVRWGVWGNPLSEADPATRFVLQGEPPVPG